jgi:hypothetical protein
MIQLGMGTNAKQANLDESATRSVKVVAGARNHLYRTRLLWHRNKHSETARASDS